MIESLMTSFIETYKTKPLHMTLLLITCLFILLVIWIIFCYLTRIRFVSGNFYRVTFLPERTDCYWRIGGVDRIRSGKGMFTAFLKSGFFFPFARQKKRISLLPCSKKVCFETMRGIKLFDLVSLPYLRIKNVSNYRKGCFTSRDIRRIILENDDASFSEYAISGVPLQSNSEIIMKMDSNTFICENSDEDIPKRKTIVFFLSNKEEANLRRGAF